MIKILMIGDVYAEAGCRIIAEQLQVIRNEFNINFVVSNIENAAYGLSITTSIANDLFNAGIDVMTSGNHIYSKQEALTLLQCEPRLLRPANFKTEMPGSGLWTGHIGDTPSAIINIMGMLYMPQCENPFATVDSILNSLSSEIKIIIVDIHACATSEKFAIGRYLDGKVSAVVGTHTHVQTADEQIFPKGTAYITDLGMTGPHDGVVGTNSEAFIDHLRFGTPRRSAPGTKNIKLHGLIIDIEPKTGSAIKVERLSVRYLGRVADAH